MGAVAFLGLFKRKLPDLVAASTYSWHYQPSWCPTRAMTARQTRRCGLPGSRIDILFFLILLLQLATAAVAATTTAAAAMLRLLQLSPLPLVVPLLLILPWPLLWMWLLSTKLSMFILSVVLRSGTCRRGQQKGVSLMCLICSENRAEQTGRNRSKPGPSQKKDRKSEQIGRKTEMGKKSGQTPLCRPQIRGSDGTRDKVNQSSGLVGSYVGGGASGPVQLKPRGPRPGCERAAEYCFESTVSEERAHWVLHQTWWFLRNTRRACVGTQRIGRKDLSEVSFRNSWGPRMSLIGNAGRKIAVP